jgi:methyl-accepting chemotaxis protein
MQKTNSLFLRLGLTIICLFSASAIIASWFASHVTNDAMIEQSKMHLEAALKSRATTVENHYRVTQKQVANLAADDSIIEAIRSFSEGLDTLQSEFADQGTSADQILTDLTSYYNTEFAARFDRDINAADYLPASETERLAQWIYIVKNPNPVGKKNEAYTPLFETTYQQAHDRYHMRLNRYLKSFDFYDIFLFDRQVRLVYSSRKETDFATDFFRGPYTDSNLGETVRAALSGVRNSVITSDLNTYVPSYDEPASFFAAPVFSKDRLIGAVAFQVSNDRVNRIVADNHGLRSSGETYIVGKDLLMRTDSRFSDKSTILSQEVDTNAARAVMNGETGSTITADYRGVSVLSQYRPLDIEGLEWGMLAEIDEAEVREPAGSLSKRLIAILVATLAAVAALTYMLFKFGVERPLANITFTAKKIIGGDYAARTPITGKDEFSILAESQNHMAEAVQQHIESLESALKEVRELKGLLPICAYCKSIRDDDGYFRTVESYLVGKSNLEFTHTFCDHCVDIHYAEESDTQH